MRSIGIPSIGFGLILISLVVGDLHVQVLPPKGIPQGWEQISSCIPGMGDHWVDKKNWPFGPIMGGWQGKVAFVEYMIGQEDFKNGKSWNNLWVPAEFRVDHIDIWYEPGHSDYESPHYHIHLYFVPHSEHLTYCPKK